jgi:hypothetical protein
MFDHILILPITLSLLILSCVVPPDLIFVKQPAPVFQPAGDLNKTKDLHKFCIINVKPQEYDSIAVYIGSEDNSSYVNKYIYPSNAEEIVRQTIIGFISSYHESAVFVDRESLSTVDCLIESRVNYARSALVHKIDKYGGYRYCYVPQVSITIKAFSTKNSEIIASKTDSLNILQFLHKDSLFNECPQDHIVWLIKQATMFSLSDFVDSVQWQKQDITSDSGLFGGTWSGKVTNSSNGKSSLIDLEFVNNAGNMTGQLTVLPPLSGSGFIKGSVSDKTFRFRSVGGGFTIDWTGEISKNKISGEYSMVGIEQTGTWHVSK